MNGTENLNHDAARSAAEGPTAPDRREPTAGQRALTICGTLGLVWIAVFAIWGDRFGLAHPVLRQFGGVLGMLALVIVGVLIGALLDGRSRRAR